MNENKSQRNKTEHSFLAKTFHWGFVILFGYGIYKQIDNINQLEDISLLKSEIIFALAFLLFLGVRFLYMTKTQKTALPAETSKTQKLAAKIVHWSMYTCLAGIAGSGLLIGYLFWLGFKDKLLIEFTISIHEFFVSIIYWLILIHILAALYHRLRKDNVWSSMVPFWKENEN